MRHSLIRSSVSHRRMARKFGLLDPCTPSDFRTIDADCYCLLNFTTIISLRASCNSAQLLLIYAVFYLGSPQKSPQCYDRYRLAHSILRTHMEEPNYFVRRRDRQMFAANAPTPATRAKIKVGSSGESVQPVCAFSDCDAISSNTDPTKTSIVLRFMMSPIRLPCVPFT